MARRVAAWFEERGRTAADHVLATDIGADGFEAAEVPFRALDLNERLPFPTDAFDLVYAIEVFEHLHRPYDVLRECHRILKPGGFLVVSTPNLLHLQSRMRFLLTGFYDLYQPPSADPANAGRLCGHIMPLHLAYYAYGLRRVGFSEVHYAHDKRKGTSTLLSILFYPLLALSRWLFMRGIRRYDAAVFEENREILALANSAAFFTSRSLMFVTRKPAAA